MRKKIAFNVGASVGNSIEEFIDYDIVYAFEPNPFSFSQLIKEISNSDIYVKPYQMAISLENGYLDFICYQHYEYSSLLKIDKSGEFAKLCEKIDPGFDSIENIIKVQSFRLDTFMIENRIDHIDFLKIDTQGYDFNVIKSLGNLISRVDCIEMEFQNKKLYEGSPTKWEILSYMDKFNFRLVDSVWNAYDVVGYEERLTFKRTYIPVVINCLTHHNSNRIDSISNLYKCKYNLDIKFHYHNHVEAETINIVANKNKNQQSIDNIFEKISTTSHLKMIERWLVNSQCQYGFFCEDIVDFSIIDYWNFKWDDNSFIDKLPPDWGVIQLVLTGGETDASRFQNINKINKNINIPNYLIDRIDIKYLGGAYILKREYAELLVQRYNNEQFKFDWEVGDDYNIPNFLAYSIPLFSQNLELNTSTISSNYQMVVNDYLVRDFWKTPYYIEPQS
jgi:FkbM family methyltransferase